MTGPGRALLAALATLVWACDEPPPAPFGEEELDLLFSLSPLPEAPVGPDGASFDARAAPLGRDLFFDVGLSPGGQVACASCHRPDRYFSDARARSSGLGVVRRNAPSVIGAAFVPFLYWDGRKDSLWSQALGPIESPDEHGFTRLGVARRVHERHRERYEALFPALPDISDEERFPAAARPWPGRQAHPQHRAWSAMTEADRRAVDRVFVSVGSALAAYQRQLLPQPAPFDRFVAAVRGGDPEGGGHLDAAAQRGLRAFLGPARCVLCHSGPLFTDHEFHNLGLPPSIGVSPVDPGRAAGVRRLRADEFRCGGPHAPGECVEQRYLDPDHPDLAGAFRTPSLRNVSETAPYMHTGQLGSLEAVVEFYRTLPGAPSVGHRDPVLVPVDRGIATADLVAFLRSLTGPPPPDRWRRPEPVKNPSAPR